MRITLNIIILLLFFVKSLNAAEFRDDEVSEFINKFCVKIIDISVSSKAKPNKLSDIISLIDEGVDSKWISRFVLGKHYRSFSKEQFESFQALYRNYMINAYAPKFLGYKGKKCSVITVADQKLFYHVKTEFVSYDNPKPYDVSFRVRYKNNQFSIIDFIAEGISLLESQRNELDSKINNVGIEVFLSDLDGIVNKLIESNKSLSSK